MALTVDCARSGERGFLDLEGPLDESGSAELRRRAVQLIATGCNELVVNVERVPGIDPEGLEALNRIEAMLPAGKQAFVIAGPGEKVRKALEAGGLLEFIEAPEPFDPSAEFFGLGLISTTA